VAGVGVSAGLGGGVGGGTGAGGAHAGGSGGRGWLGMPLPYRVPRPAHFRLNGLPEPVEMVDLSVPDLPADLEGMTILHLSDLHVRRRWRASRLVGGGRGGGRAGQLGGLGGGTVLARLADALPGLRPDVVCLTGDYADGPGDGAAAGLAVAQLVARVRPRWGCWGVFGNHDAPAVRAAVRAATAGRVTWLEDRLSEAGEEGGVGGGASCQPLPAGLRLLGLNWPEDPFAVLRRAGEAEAATREGLVITLAHAPGAIVHCSRLAVRLPLVLCGHTHGGQIRLGGWVLHTSSDLPGRWAAGVVRARRPDGGSTLGCISRGLGEAAWPGLRFGCRPQAPLYVLRRGAAAGVNGAATQRNGAMGGDGGVEVVLRW
jgi:predicted MPP superfamily phosphohydrolase